MAPRWSSPRRADRPTFGPLWARTSAALGKPFMPHQHHIANIAGEVDPDTGKMAYREVVVTFPRQSGKTTLTLPVVVHRGLGSAAYGGRQRMLYAAQTRNDARQKWEEDFVEDVRACSALRGRYRVKLVNGSEHIAFPGGTFGPIATTEKAGHGKTLDLGFLDEAFSQIDDRVEQAWRPAMITRPMAQMWIPSTAGTEASTYLLSKVKAGRKAAEAGLDRGTAYFEWAAEPGADPGDPDTWWSCMPALGHTISLEAIQAEYTSALARKGGLALFRRAYLNQWVDRDETEQVIPEADWRACRDVDSEIEGEPCFALDVAPDGAWSSIALVGYRADGLEHLEVVESRAGTDWLIDRAVDLVERWSSLPLIYDPAGPAGAFEPELRNAGIQLRALGPREMTQACGGLYNLVTTKGARHIGQAVLDDAMRNAVKRDLLDAWAWGRRRSSGDITALVAVTAARYGLASIGQITEANVHAV